MCSVVVVCMYRQLQNGCLDIDPTPREWLGNAVDSCSKHAFQEVVDYYKSSTAFKASDGCILLVVDLVQMKVTSDK